MKLFPAEYGLLQEIRDLAFGRMGEIPPPSQRGTAREYPTAPSESQLILLLRRGVGLQLLRVHEKMPTLAITQRMKGQYCGWKEQDVKTG